MKRSWLFRARCPLADSYWNGQINLTSSPCSTNATMGQNFDSMQVVVRSESPFNIQIITTNSCFAIKGGRIFDEAQVAN